MRASSRSINSNTKMGASRTIFLANLAVVLAVLFVALLAGAASLYPGGSWLDSQSPGFDFWTNYWCDLMRMDGINREANLLGGVMGQMSFLMLGLSVAALFAACAVFVSTSRAKRWIRLAGLLTAVSVGVVALSNYAESPRIHAAGSMSAGLIGTGTITILVVGGWRAGGISAWRRFIDVAFLISATVTCVVYAELILRGGNSATLPVAQKVAALFLVLWIATIARDVTESASEPSNRLEKSNFLPEVLRAGSQLLTGSATPRVNIDSRGDVGEGASSRLELMRGTHPLVWF